MKNWTLDDIPWASFDPAKVDPDMLRLVKAAGLVEYNAGDYAVYLCNVFGDDPAFQQIARDWADEEVQHGEALGRWAEMAEAGYSFQAAFKRFTDGYKIPLDVNASVRGSRTGELVARCIVETGTSSFYSALADATDEPVLKAICKRIAADEFRHYKLFYTHMKRYDAQEHVGRVRRLMVAVGRLKETDDDELAYAWHAANEPGQAYSRERCNRLYAGNAYGRYRFGHVQRAVGMILKATGFDPQGWLGRQAVKFAWRKMQKRAAALAA